MRKDFLLEIESTEERLVDTLIDKVADDLGEQVDKFIGHGALGYAYLLNSGRVLKLTEDKNEINLIYNLSKLSSIPRSLMTYYNIGKVEDTEYFYILMDYVEPLSDDEKSAVNIFYMNRIQYKKDYYENIMNEYLAGHIEEWFEKRFTSNKKDEYIRICHYLLPHIRNIVKDLKKHKIKVTDFHGGNLGWDKGHNNLILFDLGGFLYGEDRPLDRIPKLKTMQFTENLIIKFSDFKKIN